MNPRACRYGVLFVCLMLAPTSVADDGERRTWHDRSGLFTIEAEIVGIERGGEGPKVKLLKPDGSTIAVPYALLADEDQKHAVAWYQERQAKSKVGSAPKLPVVGDQVKIKYSTRWYPGKIVEVDGKRFKFRYDGYSSSWDEWKTAEQIRWSDDSPVIAGGPSDPDAVKKSDASSSKADVAVATKPAVEPRVKETPTVASKPLVPGRRGLPRIGSRVKIKWGNSWWKGVIEEVDGERFRFDYDGWDSSPDEWKTADQLRWEDDSPVIPGSPADPGVKPPAPSVAAKTPPIAPRPVTPVPTPTRAPTTSNVAAFDLSPYESSTETTSSFPKGLSPKETLAHLQQQATRGNLQVVWDWVPDDFRDYINSQEHRDALKVLDQVSSTGLGPSHFLKELIVVLRTQKTYLLNNPVLLVLLEDQPTIDTFEQVYEPATDLLDEFTQLIGSIDDEIRADNFDAAFRRRCDSVGQKVAALVSIAPPDQVQTFWERFVVNEQAGNESLTLVYPTGERKTFPLVRINGRWMPRALAESLLSMPAAQKVKVDELQSLSGAALEGRIMGAGMARGVKDASYMSLADKFKAAADAESQEEFDAAIQNLLVVLQTIGLLGR